MSWSPTTLRRRVGGFADRHLVGLGIATMAVIALITYLAVTAINGLPFEDPYRVQAVIPDDAPILRKGDEVRVAGRLGGVVRDVQLTPRGRMAVIDLDAGPVGHDVRVRVRQRGFAGSVYLDVEPGDARHPLPEKATIARSRVSTGRELATVVAGFDRDARRAITRDLTAYGGGMIGRGEDLNRAVADLRASLPQGRRLLNAATPGHRELSGLLHELDRTSRGFAPPGSRDLAGLLNAAAGTLDVTDRRSGDLGQAIDELRPLEDVSLATLPVADPLLADTAKMARQLTPAMRALASTLPDLNSLLSQGANLRQLPRLARAADPVLREGSSLLRESRLAAAALSPLAPPLAGFARRLSPYRSDMFLAMKWFNEFSGFRYGQGQARGARAIRFNPVFTCHRGRNPYPSPGAFLRDREACRL